MEELLEWMECIEDKRQEKKVRHKLKNIIVIVLFATLANADGRASHIVSAWCREDGFCLGQRAVEEKSNGNTDSHRRKIRNKRTDYVLALKGNQGNLHEDVRLYLTEPEVKQVLRSSGGYQRTIEKARSQIEIWDYYQMEAISWLT